MRIYSPLVYLLLVVLCHFYAAAAELPIRKLKAPPGFEISVYAEGVNGARSMALSPSGILFVGSQEGDVHAVVDKNKDGKADEVLKIASGLNSPNGVALKDGNLYVAEISRILRFDQIEKNLRSPGQFKVVNDTFPKDGHHGWKFIRFGPHGLLYVPVGAPCNICKSSDERYASIMRMKPDGTNLEVFAHGVRNTVGFDWDPQTKEMWFTDNGRDWLGDNSPPDELNRAGRKGVHFGYPFCHANGIVDPEFGKGQTCSKFQTPEQVLGPHVAALGIRFYSGHLFPANYQGQIFIAEHGSWNRADPIGYRISLVTLKNGKAVNYETFVEGWLQNKKPWGRPVDIEQMPDGSLLVSDDLAGAIYKIGYKKK